MVELVRSYDLVLCLASATGHARSSAAARAQCKPARVANGRQNQTGLRLDCSCIERCPILRDHSVLPCMHVCQRSITDQICLHMFYFFSPYLVLCSSLCVKSTMASPPHDLIHDLVHTHGLQAIWRLMVKPRIHRPSTTLTDASKDPTSLSSIAPTPLFDAPKPVARQEMPKFPSALSDKLTNMASTPTAFALTDVPLRGDSEVGFGST